MVGENLNMIKFSVNKSIFYKADIDKRLKKFQEIIQKIADKLSFIRGALNLCFK